MVKIEDKTIRNLCFGYRIFGTEIELFSVLSNIYEFYTMNNQHNNSHRMKKKYEKQNDVLE